MGTGVFVAVVGPSGAGKDAILSAARARLADDVRILFPARLVTRQPDSDENNIFITPTAFAERAASGGLALAWNAHGLHYGVPAKVDDLIKSGAIVVMNVSRTSLSDARDRFPSCRIVLIDASAATRAARIGERGRESTADMSGRLARRVDDFNPGAADLVIWNEGTLQQAAEALANFCQELARGSSKA